MLVACLLTACSGGGEIPVTEYEEPARQEETRVEIREFDEKLMVTSAIGDGFTFSIADGTMNVSGIVTEKNRNFIMVKLNNSDEETFVTPVINGKFNVSVPIADIADEMPVDIYAGEQEYGSYGSVILDFVRIEKSGGSWRFKSPPPYENNVRLFARTRNMDEYLAETEFIQSEDARISELADEITEGCNSDYEKARAVHDWLAENIYYDIDALRTGDYEASDAISVLENKRGVCEGYANLAAALLRNCGIPCAVQGGYALGVGTDRVWNSDNINPAESNHAWNEICADGRWILMDATWDSRNVYENESYIKGEYIERVYFDTDIVFFSLSHMAMEQ